MMITIILVFLLLSALFSGTEIAFISASKLRVELRKQKSIKRGAILANFYEKPADFLGTMLVGNNIALVIFSYFMNKLLQPYFEPALQHEALILLANTLVTTIIILIFGEFFPKTLFRLYADRLLYLLAYPLQVLRVILRVPSWFMTRLTNLILRYLLKVRTEEVESAFTRQDLENFVKDTVEDSPDDIDTDLFERALYLKNVRVKECMVPRTEIENIDINAGMEELRQLFIDTKHSRILVVRDDIDFVEGYVHHQQLLSNPARIRDIVFDLLFVPEAMRVADLMARFIKTHGNIACVVDEYGGTAGVITLEDILEEIFGEIEDEHDQEDYVEVQVSEHEYLLSGRLEIDYLNEKFAGLQLPQGEYHTLSGYLVMTTETIPEQGDEITLGDYKFILEVVTETRIETVRVLRLGQEEELAGGENIKV